MIKPVFSPAPPIVLLTEKQASAKMTDLGALLCACVEGGAGIGFVLPFSQSEAEAFWQSRLEGIRSGDRYLLVAFQEVGIAGTVMLELAPQDNGRHRAEIAKLMVHPKARRQGLARKLLTAAEDLALSLGRTLLVLDTVTGDTAETLYPKCGYQRVGVIPDYAMSATDGMDSTTVFYKQLA